VGASNCNFAYSRETGLIEEIRLNNLYRNPTSSFEGWNLELMTLTRLQENLDCYYNTAVNEVFLNESEDRITSVKGYTIGSEIWHQFDAPFFADCTGDGTIGALAGAPFRLGIEARSEFGESMCAEEAQDYVMGCSIHMNARDAGRPAPFYKPAWVKLDLTKEDFGPYRNVHSFSPRDGGWWWLEWGGELDTVHDTEHIRKVIMEIVLATWDYLKNKSPQSEKLANYELNWIGTIPGKRESRRLEGDYILSMPDIENQVHFDDAIAYGGWGFDHHPEKGFFDKVNPSYHVYHAGPYNIPLRCLYSRTIPNLYMAGRDISVTHYALSSTRVMITCAQLGEAVGMAATYSVQNQKTPRQLIADGQVSHIQRDLLKADHYIHNLPYSDPANIALQAEVRASSTLASCDVEESLTTDTLTQARMLQLPVLSNRVDTIELLVDVESNTVLQLALHQGPKNHSTYPEEKIWSGNIELKAGERQWVRVPIHCEIGQPGWHFLIIEANEKVSLHVGEATTGSLKYVLRRNDPIRPNPFSKWAIARRGWQVMSYCHRIHPQQPVYEPENVINPWARPTNLPNLWASTRTNLREPEWIELSWPQPQQLQTVHILFDSMLSFHFSQSWGGYAQNAIPSLVANYRLMAKTGSQSWQTLAEVSGNYQRHSRHSFKPTEVSKIRLEVLKTHGLNRVQVYALRVYV
ncbi:FAD-dependent oxidoreductase, partial [bacterium]|nr:FAD-dependent oxidoreductase [bacterium]